MPGRTLVQTNSHSLKTLFAKMNLRNGHIDIENFFNKHTLKKHEELLAAQFWTTHQRDFLKRAYRPQSHWIEQFNILEGRLRQNITLSELT